MARLSRYCLPDYPQHVIQRGNNRNSIFVTAEDYLRYRDCLMDAMRRYAADLHAYVFMTNHVHLLMTPRHPDSLARVLQSVGRRYVRYFNDTYRRTGTLWEGRYRATVIDSALYFLACCRYIELNPGRHGSPPARLSMVKLSRPRTGRRRSVARRTSLLCGPWQHG